MQRAIYGAIALAVCMLVGTAASHAAVFTGSVWLDQPGVGNNPTLDNIAKLRKLRAPDATFTPAPINYDSRVEDYTIGGFLNNPIFSDPSVASHSVDNSVILLTGTIRLNAGSHRFVVEHDDGMQLRVEGIGLIVDHPNPTPPADELVNVIVPATRDYNFQLSYGEVAGAPGVLIWTVDGVPFGAVPIPEPASLAVLATALAGFGAAIARRRRSLPQAVLPAPVFGLE